MGEEMNFWRLWKPTYRYLFLAILLGALGLLVADAYWYLKGFDNVIDWQVLTYLKEKPFLWKSVHLGLSEMPLKANYFVSTEGFQPSGIQVSTLPYYILLIALIAAWSIGLAVTTTLRSFWFYGSMGLLFFLLVNLNADYFMLFGLGEYGGMAIFSLLYFIPALAIYFKGQHLSLPVRILVFSALSVIAYFLIYFFTKQTLPFLTFSGNSLIVCLVISVIFIVWIAHEPVAAFVYLATKSGRGGKASLHFVILSLIYLGNLFLVYLHNTNKIDWDILYIDEFFLLAISILLGIYGWRRGSELFKGIFNVEPEGLFLYLSLALVCLATCGFAFATGNDALIEALEDAIVYSHMLIGITFFLYVIINFFDILQQSMPAHKVLYRPSRLPFFTQRLLGLILIGGLLFNANFFPVYQAMSGYYISQGDLNQYKGHDAVAFRMYERAHGYEGTSFRANYSLALYSRVNNRQEEVIPFYERSLNKRPASYGYVSLAAAYEQDDRFFDALFLLQEGLAPFPNEGHLLNNIGLLFTNKEVYDSAYLYFDEAAQITATEQEGLANREAVVTINDAGDPNGGDTRLYNEVSYLPAKNNILIRLTETPEFPTSYFTDSVLGNEQFAYLYNYLLKSKGADTAAIAYSQGRSGLMANSAYRDLLLTAEALASFKAGRQTDAIRVLEMMGRQATQNPGYYYYLLGGLAADEMAFNLSADYLAQAVALRHEEAGQWLGRMYLLTGQYQQADSLFAVLAADTLTATDEIETLAAIASFARTGFSSGPDQLGPDRLAIYLPGLVSEDSSLLQGAGAGAMAYSHIIQGRKEMDLTHYEEADYHIRQAERLMPPEPVNNRLTQVRLDWLLANKRDQAYLDKVQTLDENNYTPYHLLAKAMKAEKKGEGDETTTDIYSRLVKGYPFFEQGVLRAADYFYHKKNDELLGYESLLQSIKVNPHSISLTRSYIDYSLEMGLEEYAEERLSALRRLMSAEAFQEYYSDYLDRKKTKTEQADEWN